MTSQLFFLSNQQTTLQFYSDIVSSSLFQTPIPFIQKYDETNLKDYSIVVWSHHLLKQLVPIIVKTNSEKLNEIKHIVGQHIHKYITLNPINQTHSQQQTLLITNAISQPLFNRLDQIKYKYLVETISLGSYYLQDLNWKITKTISSAAKSFLPNKLPYILTLTLNLTQKDNPQTHTVTLEMTKVQLKQFLTQLKIIKTEMF